ncbi:aminotransferase, LLPSF_NHT_00031 family [Lishizhenia tianjinensis]|uniref:GDP-perosamine synthase n=1 Tax=Lishizhenia tianjinensis TaxID=477690 RepID=A0A1I6ZK25_9FLAO|nr:LegC family aminotransferase [Lishizhenia tianjinensis]SFT63064.1 aminotransferase, LLPSF_NHT_00031 family [Lishizhenia tianjinensis]
MIPLSIPQLEGNEWKYVKDCIDTGWISSAGSYVNQFEQMVAEYAGAKYGVACMNGTVGLHIAQILSGVTQDDHVLVPNITFIATLNAVKYTGATPILIDVDANNWQMDLDLLEDFLSNSTSSKSIEGATFTFHNTTGKRIKAIMPVHVLGNMGDMARLSEICEKYHLDIIEDSTEALGSIFKDKHSGTFGKFGVFSFNGNKIISTGGGGVIVTDDKELAEKAKHLTTQAKVSAMDYIHDEIGYNYRLVNVLAAIGVAQMETFPNLLENKRKMDAFYRKELEGVGDIIFQVVDERVNPNCWLFTFKTSKMRELLAYLNENGVQSRPFWMPMNQLEMFKKEIYVSSEDVSSNIYNTSISIPSSAGITLEQQKTVVSTIKEFYKTQG